MVIGQIQHETKHGLKNSFNRLDMPAIPKILRTHVTARLHVSSMNIFFFLVDAGGVHDD